jgi:maltooligosyltrehalose trehalohydrolase
MAHSAQPSRPLRVGAQPSSEGTRFCVWAPNCREVEVVIIKAGDAGPTYPLVPGDDGYFSGFLPGVLAGDLYKYRLDGMAMFPDPASRYQPEGVHGPSQIVDPSAFHWTDQRWTGVSLEDLVIYEIHVGTATTAGTFDSLIEKLPDLIALGVTAIQLMAVADFPGERNWGYDGVDWFAPSRNYGGPEALRRLVDAAHAVGLAVILDVVYNHLGPDGNYLSRFSRSYFSDEHRTPWGQGINYSTRSGGPVRSMVMANASYWAIEFHIDGLRFDAVQTIRSFDGPHLLEEIAAKVRADLPSNRTFLLIAEDCSNNPRLVRPAQEHGFGLDAVYADDFHHQVHVAVTGERSGYYVDYSGKVQDIVVTLNRRWWLVGHVSRWFKDEEGNPQRMGAPAEDISPEHLLYCIQNHDQIGNRPFGERLNHLVAPTVYRAVSALLLFAPYTPLLFMGQEWAASTPFLFFIDHHEELGRLATEGRLNDLERLFPLFDRTSVRPPQDRKTFLASKLDWEERNQPVPAGILRLYTDLLRLRRTHRALRSCAAFSAEALSDGALALRRQDPAGGPTFLAIVNLRGQLTLNLSQHPTTHAPAGHNWDLLLDTEATQYGGDGGATVRQNPPMVRTNGPGALLLVS